MTRSVLDGGSNNSVLNNNTEAVNRHLIAWLALFLSRILNDNLLNCLDNKGYSIYVLNWEGRITTIV